MMTKKAAWIITGSEPKPDMPSSSVTTPVTSSTVKAPRKVTSAEMRVRAMTMKMHNSVTNVIHAWALSPKNMMFSNPKPCITPL